MAAVVKLKDIIDAFDMESDEAHSYLNLETGEIHFITTEEMSAAEEEEPLEEFPEWQREAIQLAVQILESNRFIQLPDKFEINEWNIMREFALSQKSAQSEELLDAISGTGAFRIFKSTIRRLRIENNWYKFRENQLREIAADWCRSNNIQFDAS